MSQILVTAPGTTTEETLKLTIRTESLENLERTLRIIKTLEGHCRVRKLMDEDAYLCENLYDQKSVEIDPEEVRDQFTKMCSEKGKKLGPLTDKLINKITDGLKKTKGKGLPGLLKEAVPLAIKLSSEVRNDVMANQDEMMDIFTVVSTGLGEKLAQHPEVGKALPPGLKELLDRIKNTDPSKPDETLQADVKRFVNQENISKEMIESLGGDEASHLAGLLDRD